MNNRHFRVLLSATVLIAMTNGAGAALTFTGSGTNSGFGTGNTNNLLSASVSFDVTTPGILDVVLSNTENTASIVGSIQPSDILTGVYFNWHPSNTPALTPVSATIATGSSLVNPAYSDIGLPVAGNVGGEWGYVAGPNPAPGISSSGLSVFGGGNFNGPNLAGPGNGALDGLQYGLAPLNYNGANGNPAVNSTALVQNAVAFELSFTGAFDPSNIYGVVFQYGTATTDATLQGIPDADILVGVVPEPASLAIWSLLALAVGGTTCWRRRKHVA